MRPPRARAAGVLFLTLTSAALAEPSAAFLLFEAPTLAEVPAGTTLIYRLERKAADIGARSRGSEAGSLPATSTVELSLSGAETGERQATVHIVTGERRQTVGSLPGLVGNPVLLVLLERDVAEMSRMLGGSPYYIRNRIREALGESTPAEPARFTFAGREVEGWRVTVSPFAQDRNRDRLREYAAKRYEFTLSDAVPGGLYEMRMVTPGTDGTPLVEDRLAFERSQPQGGAP